MKRVLAFSGSNSSSSINQALVEYTGKLIENAEVSVIKLTDYPLPLFGKDLEAEIGSPKEVAQLKELIDAHDGYIISVPEHNSSMSAFFKNHLEWLSRAGRGLFGDKPVLLLAATPGPGAGRFVLDQANTTLNGNLKGNVIAKLGVGRFNDVVEWNEEGFEIIDDAIKNELMKAVGIFENELIKELINQ